jgi:hypothetical protein
MTLIIFFSLFFTTGCLTTIFNIEPNPINEAWVKPMKPTLGKPTFNQEGDRLYLDKESSVILRNNIIEMQAYSDKLELMIDELIDYYVNK